MNVIIILCTCFSLIMKEEERKMIWDNNKKIACHAMALVACPRGLPGLWLPRPWHARVHAPKAMATPMGKQPRSSHGGRGLEKVAPRKEIVF